MTRRAVAVLVHRRAWAVEETLAALARCDGIAGWDVLVLENEATDDVRRATGAIAAYSYALGPHPPQWSPHQRAAIGVHEALRVAFDHLHADQIVYLEEDAVLAKDALTYFEWALDRYADDPDVFCIGAWGHGQPNDPPYSVVRRPFFMPLGVGLDRRRWDEWRQHWSFDFWARGLQALRGQRSVVYPLIGRVENVGTRDGMTPEGMAARAPSFADEELLPPWAEAA